MDEPKSYKTAGAFRTALEARLQASARQEGTDLQRLRRQVAFDRFLARMFSKAPKATYPWVLKGGYAMELRIHSARTTKDIDLTPHDGTRLSKDPKERLETTLGASVSSRAAVVPSCKDGLPESLQTMPNHQCVNRLRLRPWRKHSA
jgi:hypothetical protein